MAGNTLGWGRGVCREISEPGQLCPRVPPRAEARHLPPATQLGHLRPAGSEAPVSRGGSRLHPDMPLTFMNCSIDLDAKELERKRVLGSSGRMGRCVCWGGGGWAHLSPLTHGGDLILSDSRIRKNPKLCSQFRSPEWFGKLPGVTQHLKLILHSQSSRDHSIDSPTCKNYRGTLFLPRQSSVDPSLGSDI